MALTSCTCNPVCVITSWDSLPNCVRKHQDDDAGEWCCAVLDFELESQRVIPINIVTPSESTLAQQAADQAAEALLNLQESYKRQIINENALLKEILRAKVEAGGTLTEQEKTDAIVAFLKG